MTNPLRAFNLTPFIRRFASEDPRIVQGALDDPLVRKSMTAMDLWHTVRVIKPALGYALKVPKTMPVLIIQGNNDRMLRSNGVALLLAHLHSTDETVRWFAGRGHLLLETAYVQPDTLSIVADWLKEHVDEQMTGETMQVESP